MEEYIELFQDTFIACFGQDYFRLVLSYVIFLVGISIWALMVRGLYRKL